MPTWANKWDTGVKFWKLSTGEWACRKFKTIELHNNWKLPKIPKWGGTYCFSMFPQKLQLGRKYHTPCSNPLVKKEQDHKFRKVCQLQSFSSTLIPGRSWRGGGLRLSPKKTSWRYIPTIWDGDVYRNIPSSWRKKPSKSMQINETVRCC